MSLRSWFLCLALLGGGAALLVAVGAGWVSWRGQKERLGLSLVATSRAIAAAVDREIAQAVAVAQGLSVSSYLARGDMAGFDRQARKALGRYGYALILNPAGSGRQLVDTQADPGVSLPDFDDDWIEPGAGSGSVAVKPLRRSALTGEWIVVVQVPVVATDAGATRFVMNIVIPSGAFHRIIDEQRLPPEWSPVIVDSDWTIVARGVTPEKFVGMKAATPWLQQLPTADSVYTTHVLEGGLSLGGRSLSQRYGWTAAVAMPYSAMLRLFLGPALLASLAGFGVVLLALGAVAFFSARLVGAVRVLAGATEALGKEEVIELPRLPVRELAVVGDGMRRAAVKLRDNRRLLEQRIAEVTSELRREAEERRQAEAALAHTQKLDSIGQLTGGVAHDFNNLLTIISANLELLEGSAESERTKKLARAALRGAERGARLVQSLLGFARKRPLNPETVNANFLVKEFLPVLKGAAGDAVQVQLLLSPTLHPCRVDPAQFQAALLNLVMNAQAAMPNGGRITIETQNVEIEGDGERLPALKPGSYARISVSDTGTGMTREVAAHAFEPFFTTKDIGKGTGLGLAQVYGLVKQSGGHVELVSEPAVGTAVHIYLPRSSDEGARDAQQTDAAEPTVADPVASVLVVDDDPEVRNVLVESLKALGHRVSAASDGHEALAMITGGTPFDVVLTDYLMPNGMTGRDLGRRVAELNPDIKLVLISGNLGAAPEGGDSSFAVLSKPVRQADLGRAIRRALER